MEPLLQAEGKTIAERLRAARLAANKTQQEVAGERFSKSYISAIERGRLTPSLPALDYLAGRLAVPMSYFVGETELDLSILAQPTQRAPSLAEQEQAKKEAAAQLLLCEAEQADSAAAFVLLPKNSVNQSAPSGPAVIPYASLLSAVGRANAVIFP